MKRTEFLTSESNNKNVVAYYRYNNFARSAPITPPVCGPMGETFILRLDDRLTVRVTYFCNIDPVRPDWYIIDMGITGLTNRLQCFSILLYVGEPYYDHDYGKSIDTMTFLVHVCKGSSDRYRCISVLAMETVIQQILRSGVEQ